MTNGENLSSISALHDSYRTLTQMDLPLNSNRIGAWKLWIENGGTSGDLKLVVKYINAKIREGLRKPESFKFDNFIKPNRYDGFNRWDDDLAMAKKIFRVRSDKPVNKVIQTPEGPVHYADHESTPEPKRFSLEMIAESIKNAAKQ